MFVLGATTMPTFPTIDLAEPINWLRDGFVGIVTTNAPIVIGAALVMTGVVVAISKVKGFGKSAMKG
mgnify:CR=1 FL=1